jgi:HD-GYP domain-containing protein (c-di-GMP phosphodiesterase class II)
MLADAATEVVTVRPEETLLAASRRMRDRKVGCLVVVNPDGSVAGILSERDVVNRCVAEDGSPAETLVRDCMTSPVTTVPAGITLTDLMHLMGDRHIRHIPVVDGERLVDVVSNRKVLQWQRERDKRLRDMTVFALAKLAESRDPETGGHLERVQQYAVALAKDLRNRERRGNEIDDEFIDMIRVASPLHDIGKVSIPDCVLLKPGPLNGDEWEIMQSHTVSGRDTLSRAIEQFQEADFLIMARDIAGHHHERFDGTGYPDGLAGEDIPLAARIFAVADVYDALISRRVYKPAYAHPIARNYILEARGGHFDPEVVAAFESCEPQFLAAHSRFGTAAPADSGFGETD